jgi:glycosyltransferase involved in cell wall biosynthesis
MWQSGIGKKFIWNQEDVGIGFPGPQDGQVFQSILDQASGIISNSQVAADDLISFSPNNADKVKVIRNGVTIPDKASLQRVDKKALRQKLNLPVEGSMMIKVANLTHFKDHRTVVEAAAALQAINKDPWYIVFLGNYGNKHEELVSLVQEKGLQERILFPGFQQNVPDYIKAADLALFSSWSEGIPNGVLEPMANGLPLIASGIPGNREALGQEYPYYFAPGDVIKLSELISLFLNDQDLRQKVGERCYAYVAKNFSMDKMVAETEQMINL